MKKIFFILAFVLVFFIFLPQKIQGATIYLSPASGNFSVGSTISVSVRVNTGGEVINAAEAIISYPADLLSFVWVSGSGSAFQVEAQGTGGGGTVHIARGAYPPGVSSSNALLAVVGFKVKATGTAVLSLQSGSRALRQSDSSDVVKGSYVGAKYTLGASTSLPTPTQTPEVRLEISNLSVNLTGKNSVTVSWKTNLPSDSTVVYGRFGNFGLSQSDSNQVTDHRLVIENLPVGVQFNAKAQSKTVSGQFAESEVFNFQTKGYQVKIKIVDLLGFPLVGAKVNILNSNALVLYQTDEKGEINFSNLEPRNYTIRVTTKLGETADFSFNVENKDQDQNFVFAMKGLLFGFPFFFIVVFLFSLFAVIIGIIFIIKRLPKKQTISQSSTLIQPKEIKPPSLPQ